MTNFPGRTKRSESEIGQWQSYKLLRSEGHLRGYTDELREELLKKTVERCGSRGIQSNV